MMAKHPIVCIASMIAAALIVPFILCRLFQTTTVHITAVADVYDIRIRTSGRFPFPLTVEGPYPKWSELTWLMAEGVGETVELAGVTYKKYTLGKDLRGRFDYHSHGSVWISPESKKLLVEVQLVEGHQDLMNHSGVYENVTIDYPAITPFTANTSVECIDGKYVRAMGTFHDRESRFEAAGMSFRCNSAPHGCTDKDVYEVIGVFRARNAIGDDKPQLSITRVRRIDDR